VEGQILLVLFRIKPDFLQCPLNQLNLASTVA